MSNLKIAMLISGGGTTATAVCNACKPGGILDGLISPTLVIASCADAKGLVRTRDTGIITAEQQCIIDPQKMSEANFSQNIILKCLDHQIDYICQYGWMPKTPLLVINHFHGRMINQHPGPLDTGHAGFGGQGMYGRRVHCARLYFARNTEGNMWTEVVGQRVHPEWDKGEVLKSEKVEILPEDTVDTLQARCLEAEYRVQIALLKDFAHNRVNEVVRNERLVKPHERNTLATAKMIARTLYPQG